MKYRKIGVIDSGKGGELVSQRLKELYPDVETVRYVPEEFVSYSNMSLENLFILSKTHVDYLVSQQVDCIIIGCMTLSVNCLNFIKKISPVKVFDLYSNLGYLDKSFTIIATENTIKSGKFSQCVEIPCGHLSGMIENKEAVFKRYKDTKENYIETYNNTIQSIIRSFIKSANVEPTTKLILGCSHYPLEIENIKVVFGNVEFIDPISKLLEKM